MPPTGRHPRHPELQDIRWRGLGPRPGGKVSDIDYTALEAQVLTRHREGPAYHRMGLEQMMLQISAGRAAMRAMLENLPPGATVDHDVVDLSQVATQDLLDYSRRMSEWLNSYTKRRGTDADSVVPAEGGDT